MGRVTQAISLADSMVSGLEGLVVRTKSTMKEFWGKTDKNRLARDVKIITFGLPYTGNLFVKSFKLWGDEVEYDGTGLGAGYANLITGGVFISHGYLVYAAYQGAAKGIYEAITNLV